MNVLRISLAAALLLTAVAAFALSPEHEAWAAGPAKYLMTKDDVAAWKAIKTDEEAAKFIALFWARRDPTPGTRRNEFKEDFDARVRFVDEKLPGPDGQRGSLTDRGKTFILFGPPTRARVGGGQRSAGLPAGITNPAQLLPQQSNEQYTAGRVDPSISPNLPGEEGQLWLYEGEAAQKNFGGPKAEIRFIDRHGKSDFRMARGTVDYAGAEKRAIERAITQPGLTEVPVFEQTPVALSAAAIQTELTTDALKNAVAAYKTTPKSEKTVHAIWGEYVTSEGETFVPVMLFAPKSSGLAADSDVTFFGTIEDASGKSVLAFEQPAKLTASKDDLFVDKTVKVPAGKHRGVFGLAQGGKVIALASAEGEFTAALKKDEAASSPLILSNNVYPLLEAQAPTDPFAFGGIKVVPKGDKTFRATDELWYFVELRNPGMSDFGTPNIQVKLDVTGKETGGATVKRPAPLMEVAAIEMKGVPNHYGIGNSIPLTSFKPGDYTFTVKIIDTVKKQSYTLSETFKVVE
jgi:GWxTD domain-containing protein